MTGLEPATAWTNTRRVPSSGVTCSHLGLRPNLDHWGDKSGSDGHRYRDLTEAPRTSTSRYPVAGLRYSGGRALDAFPRPDIGSPAFVGHLQKPPLPPRVRPSETGGNTQPRRILRLGDVGEPLPTVVTIAAKAAPVITLAMSEGLVGIGDGSADLAAIRALRADPPGLAKDGRRRKTFGAALEQFQQLHGAARGEGIASAPIPLFYALTQAGRAILAAHAPQPWEVRGHGLKISAQGTDVGLTAIKPDGDGLFQAVSDATGSQPLTKTMTLADTRSSIPLLPRSPALEPEGSNLLTVGQSSSRASGTWWFVCDEHGLKLSDVEGVVSKQQAYPQLAEAILSREGTALELPLEDGENARKFKASLWQYLDQGYMQPGQMPSGLMLWWMLLQALAALARYEPAAWTAAITPDRSKIAVPLEQTLQIAAMILPRLLREALAPAS